MKTYKLTALRRRTVKALPHVAAAIWLTNIILFFMILNNLHAQTKIAQPVKVETVESKTVAFRPLTEEGYILSLPYGSLVWKTYGHESTWGKNDPCKEQGLYNGFGYAEPNCFTSLKEVAIKVSNWFVFQLKTKTIKQALCYYNTGKIMDDCEYAEYTLSL